MSTSLLFVGERNDKQRVNQTVFEEVHISALLSEMTIQTLSRVCTAEDIRLRQHVFSRMESAEFTDLLHRFSQSLAALWHAVQKYENAENICERLLTFYALACHFIQTSETAEKIVMGDGAFASLTALCSRVRPVVERLKPRVDELQDDLKDIYTSRLIFHPGGVYLNQDLPERGLLEQLTALSCSLKICEISLPEQRSLAMPTELAEALLELYSDKFTKIRQLEQEFSDINAEEFLDLRDELSFFFAIHDLCEEAKKRQIPICLPTISDRRVFHAKNAYDFSLLQSEISTIVPNDIDFNEAEGFCFLTGANGGGKTTYLRAVCANLIFACAGCPVFCEQCTFYPFSFIGEHFPIDETTESGRLIEEQSRVEALFQAANDDGFLFFNETFSGANDKKGLILTLDCAEECSKRNLFALFVTHFHEVVGHRFPVLSTVVDRENENHRTYKITKNKGEKSSFAEDILRKYRLSADTLNSRGGEANE